MLCSVIPVEKFKQISRDKYRIYLPESFCEKQQGMRYLPQFPKNSLFLFNNIGFDSYFNTRECNFPMDIICLTSSNQIMRVWTVRPGLSRIGPTPYGTSKVLEAPAGWCNNLGYQTGDVLLFL